MHRCWKSACNTTGGITWLILAVALSFPLTGSSVHGQEPELWEDDPFEFHSRSHEEPIDPNAPEINEPFFAMVLQWAAEDSLGSWDSDDVQAYTAALGRSSRFPLEQLISFSRHRPSETEPQSWPGVSVRAVWEFGLTGNLTPAMPYSVLGYHPGTLRVSKTIHLSEVHLGSLVLQSSDGSTKVSDIRIFRLDSGTVVLDVDGWLDALLGKKLDDAAAVGFVVAREKGELIGLAVSLGKKGRRIYGEFDFRKDEVMPNGRAAASALSAACRTIMEQGQADPLSRAWGF